MADQAASPRLIAQDCPCVQRACPIWGDCDACVRGHRTSGAHAPECMQALLRDLVQQLTHKVEYRVVEARPGQESGSPEGPG